MKQLTNVLMAAIDIGSSAIRMDIAEIHQDGTIRILDSLKKGVQLGREAFTAGHLSQETIRAACEALRDFKKVMDTYGVVRYRAVATSAVRESSNSETFLDRLLMNTGLDVEVIDGPEENRLTISAVMDSLRGNPELFEAKCILVEVGGGSTDIALLNGGELQQSGTFPLGSIRVRSGIGSGAAKQDQQIRLLKRQITSFLSNIKREMEFRDASAYIALGGDVRFAARILNSSGQNARLSFVPRDVFSEFVDSVSRLTVDGLVQKYSIPYLDAETLAPALLTYSQILKETQAKDIIISDASIRAGILQDLAPVEQGQRLKKLAAQILSAARSLGRKYHYDENHA
jgi:exopolyphosphatase/guanosine-5'-triphosphate,3'-diphosphate pyrophosphatase